MNTKIDDYITSQDKWQKELKAIRSVLLELPLKEDIKWGIPAYIYKKKNIMGLSAFKNYCGIWFHHGCFLKDEANVLLNAQEGKTKALRQWRFTSVSELNEPLILSYINEAIENQKQGLEIKPEHKKKEVLIPELLQEQLRKQPNLNESFKTLTPFKQREFCEYIATAKRDATKQSRLEKITPMILNGVGLNDKYKNC